jgi:hypothetical protein
MPAGAQDGGARKTDSLYELALLLSAMYGEREDVTEEVLEARLEKAHALYIEGGARTQDAAIIALSAVVGFLEDNGVLPLGKINRLLLPLERLVSALQDLRYGIVHGLVQPRSTKSGTSLTRSEAEFRLLCVTATYLLERELGDDAPKEVAKRLGELGFARQRRDKAGNMKPITEGTVRNWQKSARQLLDRLFGDEHASFGPWLFKQSWSLIGTPQGKIEAGVYSPKASADSILNGSLPLLFGHLRQKK